MADQPSPHLEEDDTFGRDFNASPSRNAAPVRSGEKRPFGDLDDDEDDVFASKKGKTKVEESAPGAATGMILSLRESLQNCKDNLASSQVELEAAKSEIQKWHSAFQNIPAVPAGTNPEPVSVVTYLNNLKSSEESLREQEVTKTFRVEAMPTFVLVKGGQEVAKTFSCSYKQNIVRIWISLFFVALEYIHLVINCKLF